MEALKQRWNYLFHATKGLAFVNIALISLVTAFFGMLSGPMQEFGISTWIIKTFNLVMIEAQREGRIIMLYHTIAVSVVALEVYFITDIVPMKPHERSQINATVTFGYILTMFFGLGFAYWGHHFILHGLYLFGLSLSFFAGILLAAALWPWKSEYHVKDLDYAHTRGGLDLERVAFFTMAVATLGSATFGAITGSYWGNGHETFLAEDLIREPHKTFLQDAIIGHLHIMLTLIAIALALIIGKWYDFKGILHKIAMPLMIIGTLVVSFGAWSVTVVEWAHTIIYVGSVFVLLAALFLVIYGWDKLIKDNLALQGIQKTGLFGKMKALVYDPVKFGATWQMVFMNFTVSFVGIFMAAKLDEIFRVWPHREERIILTGHWHILAGIIATIILFYYVDMVGLGGRARKWFGWLVIIGSDLAFAAVTVFSMKRLFVSESEQQSLVNWAMILADFGLALVLTVLAIFLIWRLFDLFKKNGRWSQELTESQKEGVGK
ncbi:MAG: hypothetical protein ACK2U1_22320 [Anaerolineales bacterium]